MEHSLSFDAAHSTFLGVRRVASQVALVVKNLLANAGDLRDAGSIPGSGSFPGEANSKPLQYSGEIIRFSPFNLTVLIGQDHYCSFFQ